MLFVPEEEEPQKVEDAIVKSFPLYLNQIPLDLYPLLVQSRTPIAGNSTINYKSKSSVLEVQSPLVTDRYFSPDQAEQLGSANKVLKGVIINNNPNSQTESPSASIRSQPGTIGGSEYYIMTQANDGGLHLTSAPHTVVLNSDFNHIDETKSERVQSQTQHIQQLSKDQSQNTNGVDRKVNVVTMSAKSSKEIQPRLGGALLSSKLEMEEEAKELRINAKDEIAMELLTESRTPIETTLTKDQYLESLLNE